MREFRTDAIPRPPLEAPPWSDGYDLEIGAGAGLHAIRYARANPERRLLAIERTEIKFRGLERRRAHHGFDNLRCLRADAVAFVVHFVPPASLRRVFLLYPNPYPKQKHANLRWYNSPFMTHLGAKMEPGAELHLATNLEWYADEARRRIPADFAFEVQSERRLGPADEARTHFEKKYLARGETCFDLVFRRTSDTMGCDAPSL